MKSLIWSGAEKVASQLFQFIVMLLLSRMLGPEAFGLISITTIFIMLAQVLVDGGFTSAIIRKKNPTNEMLSTAFYFNIVIAVILYTIIYFIAPAISVFFSEEQLTLLIRVLAIVVLINSLYIVFRAKLTRSLDFKVQFKITFISSSMSGVIGISAALLDCGVWSLVLQSILLSTFSALFYMYFSHWKPSLVFDRNEFKDMFLYGYKLSISSVLEVLYFNSFNVFVGKLYSAATLGMFFQAYRILDIISGTFSTIIQRVNLPRMVMAREVEAKSLYMTSLYWALFCFVPLIIILKITSPILFGVIMGPEWSEAEKYFSVLCYGFILFPIHVLNLNLLQYKKKSGMYLTIEVLKKINGLVFLYLLIDLGVFWMCLAITLNSYVSMVLHILVSQSCTEIRFNEQFKLILRIMTPNSLAYLISNFALILELDKTVFSMVSLLIFLMSWILLFSSNIITAYKSKDYEYRW